MDERIESIKAAMLAAQQKGDHLREYDLAQDGLKLAPHDEFFQYCAVLSLSRCNAKQRALDTFYRFHLHQSHNEYVRALEPRILKDLAFLDIDFTRPRPFDGLGTERFHTAAVTYHQAYNRSGGHYAAINAATLYMYSGETASACALAEVAIGLAQQDEGPRFFPLATKSEAYLLLGREVEARAAIREAAGYNQNNLLTRARMNRQLRQVCSYMGIDPAIVDPMLPETVCYYCGHVFDQHRPLDEHEEATLRARIDQVLRDNHGVIAYGSLAAGSDILFAEAVLAQGGELNIWLPFAAEAFCDVFVRPAGEQWVSRFHRCLTQADSVSFATESDFLGDEALFRHCADVAMGMALMRAGSLQSRVLQVAVWDRQACAKDSSTCANIQRWQAMGQRTELIDSPPPVAHAVARDFGAVHPTLHREPHAILFADVRGFSKLSDHGVLWYFNELHPALAAVIARYRDDVQHVNTWGDAIYLVARRASTVVHIAAELNDAMAAADQSALGLAEPLMLRIGLHYGPVYRLHDHLAGSVTYASTDVTKTARIEPVTPPGEIFGTEPLVAMLELEGEHWARYRYAGTIPSAKGYGAFRMFHITPLARREALYCSLDATGRFTVFNGS
ncbi:MAG: adenylate/guanylate cyclase domain-containing protein [Pseudomonadota bacterium]